MAQVKIPGIRMTQFLLAGVEIVDYSGASRVMSVIEF